MNDVAYCEPILRIPRDRGGFWQTICFPRRMPNRTTKKKAEQDLAEGKSASTAAGEFVREEIRHIREGKHGPRNTRQAIAIGLSEARRAGIPNRPGANASPRTRAKAAKEAALAGKKRNPTRVRAAVAAGKKEPHRAASRSALSRQAKASAARRRKEGGANTPAAAARRGAKTKKRMAAAPKKSAAR